MTSDDKLVRTYLQAAFAAAPQPVVSVRPLEWREGWGGSNDDIVEWVADTPWGRVFASVAGYRSSNGKPYERHCDVPEELRANLQNAAQSHHEARVRATLLVQPPNITNTDMDLLQAWVYQQRVSLNTLDPDYRAKFDMLKLIGQKIRELLACPTAKQVAQVQDVAGWKLIESCPKDGSEFLAYYPGTDGNDAFQEVVRFDPEWPRVMNCDPYTRGGVDPTHWMPLPSAPTAKQGEVK